MTLFKDRDFRIIFYFICFCFFLIIPFYSQFFCYFLNSAKAISSMPSFLINILSDINYHLRMVFVAAYTFFNIKFSLSVNSKYFNYVTVFFFDPDELSIRVYLKFPIYVNLYLVVYLHSFEANFFIVKEHILHDFSLLLRLV